VPLSQEETPPENRREKKKREEIASVHAEKKTRSRPLKQKIQGGKGEKKTGYHACPQKNIVIKRGMDD